ncbi:MAG TPA: tetratricopeptide repeat protein, partial [Rhodanobacteraceae bacterium]|nr:tetratricopeptide repeat protein [Rhodanobacteraceae bacterium]
MNQQNLPPDPGGEMADTSAAAELTQMSDETTAAPTAGVPGVSIAERSQGLPMRARQALKTAGQLIEQRQLDEAERVLDKIRAQAAKHPEFLRVLGVARHLRGRHVEAATLLRRALELAPGDALIFTNLGSVLGAQRDYVGATVAFQRACALDPTLAAPWYNLGKALGKQFRVEDALAAFDEALRRDKDHVTTRIARAGLL